MPGPFTLTSPPACAWAHNLASACQNRINSPDALVQPVSPKSRARGRRFVQPTGGAFIAQRNVSRGSFAGFVPSNPLLPGKCRQFLNSEGKSRAAARRNQVGLGKCVAHLFDFSEYEKAGYKDLEDSEKDLEPTVGMTAAVPASIYPVSVVPQDASVFTLTLFGLE